tara:strand:- start:34 stop:330 length:297 start_codon:yes stop_codon:yes gene_type:complete
MTNLFILIFLIFLFRFLIFPLFIDKKSCKRSTKDCSFVPLLHNVNGQECNPDVNTKNWDLHKNRLVKFGRSQYKGLTFFVSSEEKIYYLSEEGNKIYC